MMQKLIDRYHSWRRRRFERIARQRYDSVVVDFIDHQELLRVDERIQAVSARADRLVVDNARLTTTIAEQDQKITGLQQALKRRKSGRRR